MKDMKYKRLTLNFVEFKQLKSLQFRLEYIQCCMFIYVPKTRTFKTLHFKKLIFSMFHSMPDPIVLRAQYLRTLQNEYLMNSFRY